MIRASSLPAILLALGLSLSCREIETVEAEYATLTEAKADNVVERGFVPPWLPDGTAHIKTKHDVDTGWFAVAFVVTDPGHLETAALGQGFRPVDRLLPEAPRALRSWTPAPQLARARAFQGHHYHNDAEVVLVVDLETGAAWYWEK